MESSFEKEIMEEIFKERTMAEMAENLNASVAQIKMYLGHLYRKFKVRGRVGLAVKWVKRRVEQELRENEIDTEINYTV